MEMKRNNNEASDEDSEELYVSSRRLEGAESIFSDMVAVHSVDGNTYRIKFEVQLNCDVSH